MNKNCLVHISIEKPEKSGSSCSAPRCPEHLHQVLENLQRIYRLKAVIEEHERKWSGIIGNYVRDVSTIMLIP